METLGLWVDTAVKVTVFVGRHVLLKLCAPSARLPQRCD